MNNMIRKETLVFYLIACAFSWPFFIWRDLFPEAWAGSSVPSAFRNLGVMWGPGISALICFALFRKTHRRTITFTGTSVAGSLAFFLVPYLIWIALTFLNPDPAFHPKTFLTLIPFGFLMILGEELGWRGYLQDTLRPLKEWKRWLTLGLLWEFWHCTRGLTEGTPVQIILRKTILTASVILLTVIIGKLTDRTRSLLVAITLHSWVNIQFEFAHGNAHIAGVLSILVWAGLIWKWRRERVGEVVAG